MAGRARVAVEPSEPIYRRAVAAGDALADASLWWGRRPAKPPSLALTGRDVALLERVYELKFLSASQLLCLGWGRTSTRGSTRLKLLHDAGFVDRFRAPREQGSHEWNYRLAVAGWHALVRGGRVSRTPVYKPTVLHSIAYAEHDLQLNGLILRLGALAVGSDPGPLLRGLPFSWHARSAHLLLDADTASVARSQAALRHGARHYHHADSLPGFLEPDALLRARDPDGRAFSVLIEYDRTRRPTTQRDRLRRYDRFLLDGWQDTLLATDDLSPVLLYITLDDHARDGLARVADSALTAWHGCRTDGADQGTYPGRDSILITSRERVLAGDWTVHYLPSPPPAAGLGGRGRQRRNVGALSAPYPLPQLLAAQPEHRDDHRGRDVGVRLAVSP